MPIEKPLAITMGDPAGIGPEIVVKLFNETRKTTEKPFRGIVVGDVDRINQANDIVNANLNVKRKEHIHQCTCQPGHIEVLQVGPSTADLPFGKLHKRAGQAAYNYVIHGIELAKGGDASGIVTAPINKAAMALANIPYPGHTEILADRGGVDKFAMMLVNDSIRVVLVTIHVALNQVCKLITPERELSTIRLAHDAGVALGFQAPRVAVAGLNPHAGESGLFGDEDEGIIAPAIRAAVKEGIDASGPWPGDTIYTRARQGDFDVVVAQYHDQGLIPIKYLGIADGVNITLGLPFVRTSPDHGTAFDIAGTGKANHSSLLIAVRYAQQLITGRQAAASKKTRG